MLPARSDVVPGDLGSVIFSILLMATGGRNPWLALMEPEGPGWKALV